MKFYIAGPIYGYEERNEPMFRHVQEHITASVGAIAIVPLDIYPHRHTGSCPKGRKAEGADHADGCYLRSDLQELLTCDAICLLPEWNSSYGARLELNVATHAGLEVWFWDLTTGRVRSMH